MTELLVVRAGGLSCGFRLGDVLETMRPLPVEPLSGAPRGVIGVSVVRGESTPVVDLAAVLGRAAEAPGRFVVVRAGARRVALAVDAVDGIRSLPEADASRLPPLFSDAAAGTTGVVDGLVARDGELLAVVSGARLLPEGT